jgi:hypothetical protein
MMTLATHALALGIGFFLALVAFVFLNLKKPEEVDKAEDVIRKVKR